MEPADIAGAVLTLAQPRRMRTELGPCGASPSSTEARPRRRVFGGRPIARLPSPPPPRPRRRRMPCHGRRRVEQPPRRPGETACPDRQLVAGVDTSTQSMQGRRLRRRHRRGWVPAGVAPRRHRGRPPPHWWSAGRSRRPGAVSVSALAVGDQQHGMGHHRPVTRSAEASLPVGVPCSMVQRRARRQLTWCGDRGCPVGGQ